jgi:serine/threonine protein phosphatase PrpC
MRWRGIGQSDTGRRRDRNEDSFFVDDELGLYLVSDGMGGHAAGEVASAEATRAAVDVVRRGSGDATDRPSVTTLAEKAAQEACRSVYQLAHSDDGKAGMGATLTLAIVRDGFAAIAHVGDSRCYLCRDGQVSQVTSDHTVAAELARSGVLDDDKIERSPFANVLSRAIGRHEAVKVDAYPLELLLGDRLLLCSDGMSNYVESRDWLAAQLQGDALDAIVEELITHANEGGGKDNITCVAVSIGSSEGGEKADSLRTAEVSGRLRALGSTFLFQQLSMGLLSRLLSFCEVRRFKPGDVVLREGEPCNRLIVVAQGSFELSRGGAAVGNLQPGDHTAATTLLEPRPTRATLRTTQEGVLLSLDRDAFWRLVKQRPWLGINMLERLVRKLSHELDSSIDRRDDGDDTTTPLEPYEHL